MSKKIEKEIKKYLKTLNKLEGIEDEIKKTESDLELYTRINFDNSINKKLRIKKMTLENNRNTLENNIKEKLDAESMKANASIIEAINKVNTLNINVEKSFPDSSDAYKIGKKYYETKKKEEPKDEYLNQTTYLDMQKVIQQEKDIKKFEKLEKEGLTFGGKKTKHNRKNSNKKTRKTRKTRKI